MSTKRFTFISFGFTDDNNQSMLLPESILSIESILIPLDELNSVVTEIVGDVLFDSCMLQLLEGETYYENSVFIFIRFHDVEIVDSSRPFGSTVADLLSLQSGGDSLTC